MSPADDPWVTTGTRLGAFDRLGADGLVTEVPCQACGYPTLSERGGHHVCVVCHWEDDGSSREDPDRASGVNNGLTLREAATNVAEYGVSVPPWDALTRPEFFLPAVRAARADLMAAYDRLRMDPLDPSARSDVTVGRARVMRAIVNEMR
jgi:hypothetical protein